MRVNAYMMPEKLSNTDLSLAAPLTSANVIIEAPVCLRKDLKYTLVGLFSTNNRHVAKVPSGAYVEFDVGLSGMSQPRVPVVCAVFQLI